MKKPRFAPKMVAELAKLSKFDPVVLSALAEKLSSLRLELYPFETVTQVVHEALDEAIDDAMDEAGVSGVAGALTAFLYGVGSSTELPEELLRAATGQMSETSDRDTADKVAEFLGKLVVAPQLLTSFKATSLFEDNEHLLLDSKAIVDIRPIFDPASRQETNASALLFKLRLTYRSPVAGDLQALVLTLGEDELKDLANSLTRAEQKAVTVKEKMIIAGMPVILEGAK